MHLYNNTPNSELEFGPSHYKQNQCPPVFVRFSNRDKRNKLYIENWKIKEKKTTNFKFNNLAVVENLTKHRKMLLNKTKQN